ncbi:MAG TPA: MgtC/SapB family protein [Bavariicoccus seileri]|uniref:MgtC/SapB family protein n=1 Tax=Bavariicoccus seileri TaxID=549685 RepID=A0A3D4S376_9ENTE|nr:MgtC/SapB family protein [Bavariicoccus seileri]HCS93285.1 MgtC/SapB family protein [Bavariicoccus seileri]
MSMTAIAIRLIVAAFVSSLIGFDREYKNRPAGIRTHILVCVGAAIITLIQEHLFYDSLAMIESNPDLAPSVTVDQGRIIAQIVSGIGFLGAGTIIVSNREINGLTTAASLWAVAALGIAIGQGYYDIALMGTVIILIVLTLIKRVVHIPVMRKIEIEYYEREATSEFIDAYFKDHDIKIQSVEFSATYSKERNLYQGIYTIEVPKDLSMVTLSEDIARNESVSKVKWLGY